MSREGFYIRVTGMIEGPVKGKVITGVVVRDVGTPYIRVNYDGEPPNQPWTIVDVDWPGTHVEFFPTREALDQAEQERLRPIADMLERAGLA